MRKTLFLPLLLLLAVLLILPVCAAGYTRIDDRAGFFSEGTAWNTETLTGNGAGRFSYYLLTDIASTYPSDSQALSRCGISKKDDAVILAVYQTSDGTYRYDIYTFGAADEAFSDSDIDEVLDTPGVHDNIKAGKIEAGVKAFLAACGKVEARFAAEEKADAERAAKWEASRVPRGIAVTLIVFVIAGGIAMLVVTLVYRKKVHGETYPLDCYAKLRLTKEVDRFVGSYITRVRVNTNNGSSGGSRGGGGGGGGGHRGGR